MLINYTRLSIHNKQWGVCVFVSAMAKGRKFQSKQWYYSYTLSKIWYHQIPVTYTRVIVRLALGIYWKQFSSDICGYKARLHMDYILNIQIFKGQNQCSSLSRLCLLLWSKHIQNYIFWKKIYQDTYVND